MIELITGKAGRAHVDSEDVGAYQAFTFGSGCYVLHGCECSMTDANTAHVSDGELLVNGRHVRITGNGIDVTIDNGTQAQVRSDLVCVDYSKQPGSGVEAVTLTVVKGQPAEADAADPAHVAGSIIEGDTAAQFPLYRVRLDGINVGEPELMFQRAGSLMDVAADPASVGIASLIGRTALPSGANLNAYVTVGHYYSNNATQSATIANTPYTGGGFGLVVRCIYKYTTYSIVIQELTATNGTRWWRRTGDSGATWTAWKRELVYEEPSGALSVPKLTVGGTQVGVPKQLYANTSGTRGTITLTGDSFANYRYIDVFPALNDGVMVAPVRIWYPDGKTADLVWAMPDADKVTVTRTRIAISGAALTQSDARLTNVFAGTVNTYTTAANTLKIVRVVGYE